MTGDSCPYGVQPNAPGETLAARHWQLFTPDKMQRRNIAVPRQCVWFGQWRWYAAPHYGISMAMRVRPASDISFVTVGAVPGWHQPTRISGKQF